MIKIRLLIIMIAAFSILFSSCEKDDPVIPNEEELITTLNYTLTPAGGGTSIVLSFLDLDGDGGNSPTITGGTLDANQNYSGSVELLNEAELPIVDITEEVQNEAEEHQFFFQTNIPDMNIEYSDQDVYGFPLGLSTTLTTGAVATGTLTVILRHEPDKSGQAVSEGDITNAGGETDIEVTFPIVIQ